MRTLKEGTVKADMARCGVLRVADGLVEFVPIERPTEAKADANCFTVPLDTALRLADLSTFEGHELGRGRLCHVPSLEVMLSVLLEVRRMTGPTGSPADMLVDVFGEGGQLGKFGACPAVFANPDGMRHDRVTVVCESAGVSPGDDPAETARKSNTFMSGPLIIAATARGATMLALPLPYLTALYVMMMEEMNATLVPRGLDILSDERNILIVAGVGVRASGGGPKLSAHKDLYDEGADPRELLRAYAGDDPVHTGKPDMPIGGDEILADNRAVAAERAAEKLSREPVPPCFMPKTDPDVPPGSSRN
jgi:hypothetical protein